MRYGKMNSKWEFFGILSEITTMTSNEHWTRKLIPSAIDKQ